jgi:hypothetical protein
MSKPYYLPQDPQIIVCLLMIWSSDEGSKRLPTGISKWSWGARGRPKVLQDKGLSIDLY